MSYSLNSTTNYKTTNSEISRLEKKMFGLRRFLYKSELWANQDSHSFCIKKSAPDQIINFCAKIQNL